MNLRLGTRGSPLALKQAEEVIALLQKLHPRLEISIEKIRTSGDQSSQWNQFPSELTVGAFTRELEEYLLAGRIDFAVHSLKDLQTEIPSPLELIAVPLRRDPADALLSREGIPFSQLPSGSRIGTGSLRRKTQLLHLRPDFQVLPLRGNLETRIKKLKQGEFDAIIAAVAGLERLGLESEITESLDPARFLPAVGQAALGIEVRRDQEKIRELLRPLNHPKSRAAVNAERSFLHRLGVGCRAPAAAWARIVEPDRLYLQGIFADPECRNIRQGERSGPADHPEAIGRDLAEELLSK